MSDRLRDILIESYGLKTRNTRIHGRLRISCVAINCGIVESRYSGGGGNKATKTGLGAFMCLFCDTVWADVL